MTVLENLHLVKDGRMTHAGDMAIGRRHHPLHPRGRSNLRRFPGSARSVPHNPLLFSILYRMRLVEQIGSGIRRIHDGKALWSQSSKYSPIG